MVQVEIDVDRVQSDSNLDLLTILNFNPDSKPQGINI